MSRAARQRRALNMVWTAAGEYGFLPSFLAYRQDGTPDRYLNAVIGLAHKFYDSEALRSYQQELDSSLLRDMFTDIFWLGIEHAVFAREAPRRPVLSELRREHARFFFEEQIDSSMQQLMLRNEIVHSLRSARCHEMLGEPIDLRNPWDKRLYAALAYPGEADTEEIIWRTRQVLKRFFVFRFTDLVQRKSWHLTLNARLLAWLKRVFPLERRYVSEFTEFSRPVWSGGGFCGEAAAENTLQQAGSRTSLQAMREMFGSPLLQEAERLGLEEAVCQGGHVHAHLYWAKGGAGAAAVTANRRFLQEQGVRVRTGIRQLSEQLKSAVAVHRQPLMVQARAGRFAPSLAWRAGILHDERVFTASRPEPKADFVVTVLLDGSESRQGQQGIIAVQAYMLAKALALAGIPVRVLSFASVQDYTVLSELKGLEEGPEGGLDYLARGWNRDGLALRALGEWLKKSRRPALDLVLVLTDVQPSDSLGMAHGAGAWQQAYMGKAALEDTAEAVRELRRQGVRVVALVESVVSKARVLEAARKIYGKDFVWLSGLDDLARQVGRLIIAQVAK